MRRLPPRHVISPLLCLRSAAAAPKPASHYETLKSLNAATKLARVAAFLHPCCASSYNRYPCTMLTDACCAVAIARHFSVRKLRRALRRLVRSAPFHEPSLLCFGLLFVRQRVGGGAPVAELAERLGAGVAAGRRGALAFDELVVRRVFGGRGVEAMARSMRAEMMRMLQTGPVCAFAVNLQVMGWGGEGGCMGLKLLFGVLIVLLVFAGGGERPRRRKRGTWCCGCCRKRRR